MVAKELTLIEAVLTKGEGLHPKDREFLEHVKRQHADMPISSMQMARLTDVAKLHGIDTRKVMGDAVKKPTVRNPLSNEIR